MAIAAKKPHGWNMDLPGQNIGNIPQGATSAQLNLTIGMLLLLMGIALRRHVFK